MNNKRKIVSTLLALSLIIGSILAPNTTASAESTPKYLKVNNTVLEFNEVVYVDGTNGNDSSGNGCKEKPFKTVERGVNYLSNSCRENGAVVIGDGTYDISGLYDDCRNLKKEYTGMKLSLIASTMGNVSFKNAMEMFVDENSSNAKIKVNFYGINFKSKIETQAWYCLGGDDWMNEYYNCVFVGEYGGWNGKIKNASIKVENSLFIGSPSLNYSSTPLSGTAINCASTSQYIDPCNGTKTNCLYNVIIDSNYNITSNGWKNAGIGINPDGTIANIGVYGGQFSWGSKAEEIPNNNKLKIVLSKNEKLQLSVDEDLTENTNVIWISSDSSIADVDANGVVTAQKIGNVVVAVSSEDGAYTEYVNILVVEDADDYRLAIDLIVGESCRITVDDYTNTVKVIWTSMDTANATVTGKGKVKAVSKGLTIVTATDADGNEIGQIYVRVRE